MTVHYSIPAGQHRVEEEIDRSRFITTVACVPTVEAARAFIDTIRAEFADASHNCWAYLVGPPGSTGQVGYSDDGEPHGTAGRPMFTVLEHSGLGDVAAVVTRYFGGRLLGRGGLVRAYSGGVKLALETLPLSEHRPMVDLSLVVEYGFLAQVQYLLPEFEAEITEQEYGVDVSLLVRLPQTRSDALQEALLQLTAGAVLIGADA
ncbi:MAG: YigZ family protein [Caldilineae bacterium]|nr:YigZ family protein [Anaerolineae bacterium]MCB0201458.1 YigZ family protein [Anaerolineae bacterium]MCB0206191.1 YigZ family protein [Anaerolineae bacterium]MCB0255603.1 YigZ family protein [Anaerolineae bacterium]MCB9153969.1 YigZ family protein [Caldilineae bacterium]